MATKVEEKKAKVAGKVCPACGEVLDSAAKCETCGYEKDKVRTGAVERPVEPPLPVPPRPESGAPDSKTTS